MAGIYAVFILLFTIGWNKNKRAKNEQEFVHSFSIIIPFYNEQENIPNLLIDLEKLDYPRSMVEIIMINNESTDESGDIIRDYIFENDSKIRLHNSIGGKKDAVWKGINESEHDFVLSIDADCRVPSKILQQYNSLLLSSKVKMVSGPVVFAAKDSFWGKFMEFEFMSLVASGAGAIGVGMPIMANAANMLFDRKMALEAEHVFISEQESGDDIFLLQYVVNKYGAKSVSFLKSEDAIVVTDAPDSIKSWVNQRLRWTAKSKSYSINATSITALVILSYSLLAVILISMSYINIKFLLLAFAVIAFKTIVDLPILYISSGFFDKKHILKYSIFFEIIYPFYVVIIAFTALFYGGKWKDEA